MSLDLETLWQLGMFVVAFAMMYLAFTSDSM